MMIHLLIVDALNLIRRIHAVQGSPCVNACRHALQQLIQHSRPTHAVAVFDEDDRRDSWRHQILPDYKAGRSPMPENLQQEMPQLREAFAELGVASWHSPGNEADDLAATLAAKVAGGGHQVTIVSTDKGYCQLLAPNVQIRDYFQKNARRAGAGGDRQQQDPRRGGYRAKTAVLLLQQSGSLDGLYQHLEQVPEKWRGKLEQHRELAYVSKQVATLRTDLSLDGNLQQLRRYNKGAASSALYQA